jgi:hypothetical protein
MGGQWHRTSCRIHIFFGKDNADHELGTGFFCDRMSCIILRGLWCNIFVLNVDVPTGDKVNDVKDSFYEELEHVFDKFPNYHMNILLGDFDPKIGSEYILSR